MNNTSWDWVSEAIRSIANLRVVLIVAGVFIVVLLLNITIDRVFRLISKLIAYLSAAPKSEKLMRYKQMQTTFSIAIALTKLVVVVAGGVLVWRSLAPTVAPLAAVGASTMFAVIAGATLAPILRDITIGSVMIAERWYGVGDFVALEPFGDVKGVVEQVTLRSTKLRTLGGEVVWVHNQQIQAVKVRYRGLITIEVDVFVRDIKAARILLDEVVQAVPKGSMLVVDGLEIVEEEELGGGLWRVCLRGRTIPGREWLIEKFAIDSMKESDAQSGGKPVITFGPIARYVDSSAEKRFKRSLSSNQS